MTGRAGASRPVLAGGWILLLYALALAAWSVVGLARTLDTLRDPAMGLPGLVILFFFYVPLVGYVGTLLTVATRIVSGRSSAPGLIASGILAGVFALVLWLLFTRDRDDPVIWASLVVAVLCISFGLLGRTSK